jgi:hypothetical protein
MNSRDATPEPDADLHVRIEGTQGQDEPASDPRDDAAGRNYLIICMAGLVVIFFVLMRHGLGSWSLMPVLVGLLGLTLRWRMAPVMLLLVLTSMLFVQDEMNEGMRLGRFGRFQFRTFHLTDWFLCAAVLAYCAAHYRLQGLTDHLLPLDRRRRETPAPAGLFARWFPRLQTVRRPGLLVSAWEVSGLLMAVPVWAFLAQLVWKLLPGSLREYELPSETWQAIILAWLLGVLLLVAAGFLSYLRWTQMTAREAELFLQEVVWKETRREQRRVSTWLTWAWLRRRKGKS